MKRSRLLLLAITGALLVGVVAAGPASGANLVFGNQPADSQKGLVITSTKFDANQGGIDGPLVTVLAPANTSVTVSITGGSALQTVVADGNGVATFDNLKIGTPGTYTLTATASGLNSSATSNSFRIFDSVATCNPNVGPCHAPTGSLKNNDLIADFTGSSVSGGILATSIGIESAPTCSAPAGTPYNPLPGVVSAYWTNLNGFVNVTLTVSKAYDQRQSNNGVSFYQICFTYDDIKDVNGNPKTFADRYTGAQVTSGFLPDCGPKVGPPCVVSRNKTNGQPIITLRIPEDMRFH